MKAIFGFALHKGTLRSFDEALTPALNFQQNRNFWGISAEKPALPFDCRDHFP